MVQKQVASNSGKGNGTTTSRRDVARAAMWERAARVSAVEISSAQRSRMEETATTYAIDLSALSRNAKSLLTLYPTQSERVAMASALREAADLCDSPTHKTTMLAVANGLEKGTMSGISGIA